MNRWLKRYIIYFFWVLIIIIYISSAVIIIIVGERFSDILAFWAILTAFVIVFIQVYIEKNKEKIDPSEIIIDYKNEFPFYMDGSYRHASETINFRTLRVLVKNTSKKILRDCEVKEYKKLILYLFSRFTLLSRET